MMDYAFDKAVTLIVTICGIFSIVGSLLIVFSYLLFKEHRTLSRKLVAWLALCDLGQGIFFATQFAETRFCRGHAYLGIVTATSSFLWTTAISFFVYTFFKKQALFPDYDYSCLLNIFHVICWGYPFTYVIILFLLEPDIIARGTDLPWCFIDNQTPSQIAWGMFAIYVPLYVSWALTFLFYWLARQRVRQARTRSKNPAARQELLEVSRKLRLIPLMFVSLRVWGAIYRMIQFTEKEVATDSMRWLAIMAAFGDPSQGTANALVFVIFTKKIRQSYHQLFARLCCCRKVTVDEETLLREDSSSSRPHRASISSSNQHSPTKTPYINNPHSSPSPSPKLNSRTFQLPSSSSSTTTSSIYPQLLNSTSENDSSCSISSTSSTSSSSNHKSSLPTSLSNSNSSSSPHSTTISVPSSSSTDSQDSLITVPLLKIAASNSGMNDSLTSSQFSWRNWFGWNNKPSSSPTASPEALNLPEVGPKRESGSPDSSPFSSSAV